MGAVVTVIREHFIERVPLSKYMKKVREQVMWLFEKREVEVEEGTVQRPRTEGQWH